MLCFTLAVDRKSLYLRSDLTMLSVCMADLMQSTGKMSSQ